MYGSRGTKKRQSPLMQRPLAHFSMNRRKGGMHIREDGSSKDATHRAGIDLGSRNDPSTLVLKPLEGQMGVPASTTTPTGTTIH